MRRDKPRINTKQHEAKTTEWLLVRVPLRVDSWLICLLSLSRYPSLFTLPLVMILATVLLSTANAQAGRRRVAPPTPAGESIAPEVERLYLQGVRELNTGQHAASLATLDKAIELDSRFAEAHIARGRALINLERQREAVEAFKQALTIAPTNARAHYELGVLYNKLKDYAPALDALREAAQLDPTNARAFYELGDTYLSLDQTGAATRSFLRAVEIERGFTAAVASLERLIAKAETLPAATFALASAVEARPLSASARYYFARALFLSGKRKDALKQGKVLKELDPDLAARLEKEIGV